MQAPAEARTNQKHFFLINLLKAGAAQLIVLHHLAFYGPMADQARALVPDLIDWLYRDARIAVQVFLVIGGFLAAKSLAPNGGQAVRASLAAPLQRLWRRYLKLAPPFIAAIVLAVLASSWAGVWMSDPSISPPPTFTQLAAHVFLLHGVLGMESLSAGAWYVAIDFQLYALLTLLLWAVGRLVGSARAPQWLLPLLVLCGVFASLCYFNLDADWDVWAPYFFGAYGLGALAWWISDPERLPGSLRWSWLLAPAVIALSIDFRSRIAVAAITACVLVLCGRSRLDLPTAGPAALLNRLGTISYSIFLVHFPVCLMVNAAFSRFVPAEPELQVAGMALAWLASLGAGALFHRWVETPLGRLFNTPLRPISPQAARLLRFVPIVPAQPFVVWRRS
ncbi:MAG: acyltransferase family protein [Massilia sp.]